MTKVDYYKKVRNNMHNFFARITVRKGTYGSDFTLVERGIILFSGILSTTFILFSLKSLETCFVMKRCVLDNCYIMGGIGSRLW